jgi:hypothetical protein
MDGQFNVHMTPEIFTIRIASIPEGRQDGNETGMRLIGNRKEIAIEMSGNTLVVSVWLRVRSEQDAVEVPLLITDIYFFEPGTMMLTFSPLVNLDSVALPKKPRY